MSEKLESREKIKKDINTRKGTMDNRVEHMGRVVEDKENVVETSQKLNLSTTEEGAEAIKRSMENAAESTQTEFENQDQDLQEKVDECKRAEEDLLARTENAKQDANEAKAAKGKMKETKEAKHFLDEVKSTSDQDANFTKTERNRQKEYRTNSENRRNEQKQRLQAAKLKW